MDKWMNKQIMGHPYNGILFTDIKNWAIMPQKIMKEN